MNNIKGQALLEFTIIISILMFLIIGIMQFVVIHSIKLMVNYAAYTACRTGIVNYDENGRFDINKIRLSALLAVSPVVKGLSRQIGFNNEELKIKTQLSLIKKTIDYSDRLLNAGITLDVIAPDENILFDTGKIRASVNPAVLTVKLAYNYKPIIPFIARLFPAEKNIINNVCFMKIAATASMPVEIGPIFTTEPEVE